MNPTSLVSGVMFMKPSANVPPCAEAQPVVHYITLVHTASHRPNQSISVSLIQVDNFTSASQTTRMYKLRTAYALDVYP